MDVATPLRPADLFSAKGLVVVITGGGSAHSPPPPPGLGLAIASALYQNGAAHIYLLGRRADVLQKAADDIQSTAPHDPQYTPGSIHALPCDVANLSSVRAAADTIKQEIGYVDVLINNAGVLGPRNGKDIYAAENIQQLADAMLAGYDDEKTGWTAAMAINTQSVIGVSASFLPLLDAANTRRGWATGKVSGPSTARNRDLDVAAKNGIDADDDRLAHIITVASVASYLRIVSAGLAYNASKAAASHLGKMLATVLAEWGVRSNIVCPGPYPSDMTVGLEKVVFGPSQIPQGRMGGIGDVGGLMLFLVGKAGTFVNGSVQLTDGGRAGVLPGVY
ncbi:hypothetical protein ACET3X_009516 [Alternaria dauci]|uniref:Uncharacterized protein n=1 Tax=Alternaria dauci TaxID=48095 RepID=A0ABR3U719_9PLEO